MPRKRSNDAGFPIAGDDWLRTCIRCHSLLGENRLLEYYPVGERIAFDVLTGWIWVGCPQCRRWTVSPEGSIPEVVESTRRHFENAGGTSVQAAVMGGPAELRARDGTLLVRLHDLDSDAFTRWRYGYLRGTPPKGRVLAGGALAAGLAGVLLGGPVGVAVAAAGALGAVGARLRGAGRAARAHRLPAALIARAEHESERRHVLQRRPRDGTRLLWTDRKLRVQLWQALATPVPALGGSRWVMRHRHEFQGNDAWQVLSMTLVTMNRRPLHPGELEAVLKLLKGVGGPEGMVARAVQETAQTGAGPPRPLEKALHRPLPLALEIAVDQLIEAAALRDGLADLRLRWVEADMHRRRVTSGGLSEGQP